MLIPSCTAEEGTLNVQMDDAEFHGLGDPFTSAYFREYDIVAVEVNVISGGPIDVYLMEADEYDRMQEGKSFKTVISQQNVNKTSFEWEKDDDEQYVVGFDNSDNARSGDAVPRSSVYLEFKIDIDERHQDMKIRRIWYITGAVAIAIVVVTNVVLRRMRR